MKIRLHGLPEEVEQTKKVIKMLFNVNSTSEPYHDRGDSKYVRCYIDVEPTSINLIELVLYALENVQAVETNYLMSALLKCETCPIRENCLAFGYKDTKSLSGCVAMCELIRKKIADELKPFYKKDDRDGIRSVIEKHYGVKGGNE